MDEFSCSDFSNGISAGLQLSWGIHLENQLFSGSGKSQQNFVRTSKDKKKPVIRDDPRERQKVAA